MPDPVALACGGRQIEVDRSRFARRPQRLLRVEHPRGAVLVKEYGAKRSALRLALVQLGHWTFAGKSPATARGRCANERAVVALWAREGFDVFRFLPEETERAGRRRNVFAWEEGRTLYDTLGDPAEPEAQNLERLGRFGAAWARRHRRALELSEPRLLHEHGTFRHVLVAGRRLITFDLEVSWVRRGSVERLAGREVAAFVRSLARASVPERFEPRLRALVAGYADRALLRRLAGTMLRPRGPRRLVAGVDAFRRRRDPLSPVRVLTALESLLDEA